MRVVRRSWVVVVAVLVTIAGCSSDSTDSGAAASSSAPEATSTTGPGGGGADADTFGHIPDLVRSVEPSVVAVITDTGQGSGVVWDADGVIVTNDHVVDGASEFSVAFADGQRSPATVVATDAITDLAVLRTERRDLPAATFSEDAPEVGELAVAIGNSLGFENTVSAGIVSGVHRSIPGSAETTQSLVDLLQTDAAISPGNSGGALVDAAGEVMGINVAYIPPQQSAVSIGFAIPSTTVIDVVTQLLEDGTASHAYLGVQLAALTPQIAQRLNVHVAAGAVVLEAVTDGPAAGAGLEAGDVIVAIDGNETNSVEDVLGALHEHQAGDVVTVTVDRGDETKDFKVALTDRPS
jgi:S1-C subfamily serine protease